MIDILKKEIEAKIGKKVTNRGDCELVSNVILETLDEEISYSTIRRLYGLVNETKPSLVKDKKVNNIGVVFNSVKSITKSYYKYGYGYRYSYQNKSNYGYGYGYDQEKS